MTTAREVLQLIITGDGRGAIVEMEKVGGAARKNLTDTEQSLGRLSGQLTSFGVGAVTAGAVASVGLFGASRAAGQLNTDLGRITNQFGDSSAAALTFVKDANQIGLSDQAAAAYVANIGELATGLGIAKGEASGLTTQTISLISQLALIKGISPDQGLEAVSAGLIGEYDSLQRLIPVINAAAIEERALADTRKENADQLTAAEKATATFGIITDYATDAIERSGGVQDNVAVRSAKLAAAYGDLKTQIGEGALPVTADRVGFLTGLVGGVTAADEATGGLVGTLATVGTVGALGAGGLALVVGQGIKAVEMGKELATSNSRVARSFAGIGAGAGVALAAAALLKMIDDSAVGAAGSVAEMQAALNDSTGQRLGQQVDQILGEIDNRADSAGDKLRAFFSVTNIYGDNRSLQAVREDFEALAAVDPSQAEQLLDAVVAAAATDPDLFPDDRSRGAWEDVVSGIRRYIETQRLAAAATDDTTGAQRDADAVAQRAASSLNRLAYSYNATADAAEGSEPGAIAYAAAVRSALDPVLALADANMALADAQKRMAEAADTNGKDVRDAQRGVADAYRSVEDAQRSLDDSRRRVTDATRDLADAQRELNEVLADDPMFGLTSVSPEEEIADARSRLAEANRRLAANPGDGFALTMRDEALMDLEAASKRRQDMARDAEQRAKDVERAQRSVEDAQRGLSDAQRGVGDAERGVLDARLGLSDAQAQLAEVNSQHGLNSEEYQRAALDVIRATLDVQDADAELAQYLKDNGIQAVGGMIEQLDEWIGRGGPVGEAAARMKAALQPLVEQSLIWAAGLREVNAQMGAASQWEKTWERLTWFTRPGGQPPSSRRGGAGSWGGPGSGAQINPSTGGWYVPGGSTGGRISGPGGPTADEVLLWGSNGEWMIQASTASKVDSQYGPGAMAYFNQTGELPTRRLPSSRLPGIPAAGGSSAGVAAGGASSGDGLIIEAQITQVVPRPELAGDAVLGALRRIAHRSGRGLKVDQALAGQR